ncbi:MULTISPECIES: glycosyltransferase family 4 protein [Neisseria]|uniref:glycosyltransferase family 4 protein n=1 Tax=Neisseria TaxID=482 RepID=UPI001E28FC4C|nr:MULTISPECIES: glycosyltransferase family 4 protein [Neisseria]
MRVAYICADPGIPVFGTKGASVHVQEVIKGMLQKGLDVTLFAQRLDGDVPEELKNITIRRLDKLPKDSAKIRARAALDANAKLVAMLEAEAPFDMVYERYSLWSNAGMQFAKKTRLRGHFGSERTFNRRAEETPRIAFGKRSASHCRIGVCRCRCHACSIAGCETIFRNLS